LHGIPGILGGIISAIGIAAFSQMDNIDNAVTGLDYLPWYKGVESRGFYKQGGLQIAGTFTSLGIALVTGIVAGLIIRTFYSFGSN
jgi:hypothetical protein